MSDIAIRVDSLSKKYRIGTRFEKHKTLRETIAKLFSSTFRGWNRRSSGKEIIWALKDLSFEIKRGQVVGIIGRNGAGKSTLMKILSRITEPTSGYADIYGRVGSLLEVGTGFHWELTGRENIYLSGAIMGMKKSEIVRKFDEIVAFAEMEKFIDTPVKHYSSGMYMRLAFAVAAHLEPEILLVDEVLAVGDAQFQKKCLGKMDDIGREGRTVLFVSHNMGAIRNLCTAAIWLQTGKVIASAETYTVVNSYLKSTSPAEHKIHDLQKLRRSGNLGKQLRLTKINFNNGFDISHGQPLTVEIEYETFSYLEGVSIGFGFSTLDGTRLITIETDLVRNRPELQKGLKGKVIASLQRLDLQPGRYNIDVGARSGDYFALDYLPSCTQVEILPSLATPTFIIRDSGGVRVPAEWRWI